MPNELLRALVDCRDRQVQKARIQFGNRLAAIKDTGTDASGTEQTAIVSAYEQQFEALEKRLDRDIARMVSQESIYEPLVSLRGIGPMLAAKFVSMVDIAQCDTISSLWRFAGYGVVDGAAEKPVKGEKLHYNKRLKTTCYLIATSFMRANSPYRCIYDEGRTYYGQSHADWTKLHQHRAATRKMIKLWLSHVWLVWRQIEGLPVSDPYIIGQGGHSHIYKPEEFGWRTQEGGE